MNNKKNLYIALAAGAILLSVSYLVSVNNSPRYSSTASMGGNSVSVSDSAMYGEDMEMVMEESADFGIAATSKQRSAGSMVTSPMPEPPIFDGGSVAADVDPADRLIIKNGSLGVVVKDVRNAAKAVQVFAEGNGGFVVSSNIYENGRAPSATVLVRIPSESFEQAISSVQGLGTVEHESISGQDVTEEFVDIEAQLKNYKATEEQFLAIMARATDIPDVLAVQRELTNVRNNIDRLEGRMKFLSESAAFSSLTVNLSTDPEDLPIVDKDDKWKPIVVIKDAVRNLIEVGQSLAALIIQIVVFAPIWILLILIAWFVKRRYSRGE